jgi:uncharacterized protein GlcG (DUF336 family)
MIRTGLAAAMLLAMTAPADAQVLMQPNISLAMAVKAAQATIDACKAKGFDATAAAVVDRAGQTIVLMRNDAATDQNLEMARRKAFTARMFRRTTIDWATRTREDPVTYPQRDLVGVLALGGGVPIQLGKETIGAVGSAGSTQDDDDACAKAGVAAIADQLHQ